jgi:hypothetical protein
MENKKRNTKLKLEDIPAVNTSGRALFIEKITKDPKYIEALESGIPGFYEEELCEIEEKYKEKGGMFQEDIQNELRNKGWYVKPNTIKHYIQANQLPKPVEPRMKTERGAVSLYPINFMRHLNLVRFALNVGKGDFLPLILLLNCVKTAYERLLEKTDKNCYDNYSGGFFNAFWVGISDLESGSYYAKEAVESAKLKKYQKRLIAIEKLTNDLKEEITAFEKESKESPPTFYDPK